MTQLPTSTLMADLLTRIAAIQATITVTSNATPPVTSSIAVASSRYWEPVNEPYPQFRNRGITDPSEFRSREIRVDMVGIQMLLIGGPAGSGYLHEREDAMNNLWYAVLDKFASVPHLNDPISGAPFAYIDPTKRAHISGSTGKTVQFADPTNFWFAIDFTLQVGLFINIPRVY